MITRAEAEAIAARWASNESEQRGYGCEPMLAEFDLGFVIWTRQPSTVLSVPGDGARTVIDRETGVLSTWPGVPPEEIAAIYRERRPSPPGTVDPAISLLRLTRRRPAPTTVVHFTVDDRLFRTQGAKGDQVINHHPLVVDRLEMLGAEARVRGAERHAELIAVSDALHEASRARGREIALDEARAWLTGATFAAFLVRDQGDPAAGQDARPCETCIGVLVDLAVLPWSDLAFTSEWRHGSDRIPVNGRFPYEVARTLAGGGWIGPSAGDDAVERAVAASGGRLEPFDAARGVIADFPGVRCARRGPGLRRAIRLLRLDPVPGAYAAAALVEFGQVIEVPLFPIGIEGGDGVVALDELGRVFVLDQAGEWFVGSTVDEALTGLLTGDGPARRVRDDGSW
ncbi:SUKH-3 domain-containing protein [Actinoplanes sp. LDG1-06]|uniref:SUKH-3 domain-containing protein n=1 Tax=Paractinoplanes ovalisporus TaxID=2810368 RepID=A0ABS2ACC4_9ACTN|nr:SUKH-3 domain-containing protein [Actinoplanes ovalisporus]MBM2616926.1 SUKH-3 domain-containing protein [Actinoplanes ovalisporus]